MNKKSKKRSEIVTTISVMKFVIEAVVFIGLICTIVYLIKSQNGVMAVANGGQAQEKLDAAMKTFFAQGQEGDIEDVLNNIEGIEDITSGEEKTIYRVTIDGTTFVLRRSDGTYYEETYVNPNVVSASQENETD